MRTRIAQCAAQSSRDATLQAIAWAQRSSERVVERTGTGDRDAKRFIAKACCTNVAVNKMRRTSAFATNALRKNRVIELVFVDQNEIRWHCRRCSVRPTASLSQHVSFEAACVMTSLTAEEKQRIAELVASRQAGLQPAGRASIPTSSSIAPSSSASGAAAGCSSAIRARFREPGDYFTFAVDNDSLIVIRDDDGEIHALWNVCRHRGTQICDEPQGRAGRLVCPYHQWTYGRDGSLALVPRHAGGHRQERAWVCCAPSCARSTA